MSTGEVYSSTTSNGWATASSSHAYAGAVSDVLQLLTFVIPAAIGSAMSPAVLASMTGILSQAQHPRMKGLAFLVGGLVSLLCWVAIVYSAVWAFLQRVEKDALVYINVIDISLGVLLLLAAMYLLIFKPQSIFGNDDKKEKATEAAEGASLHLGRYAGLGFVMQGRDVSSIVLFIAALQHIARSSVAWEAKVLVVALLMSVTSIPMWLPLVTQITVPKSFKSRAEPFLVWLRGHARKITIGVCLVFSVYLIIRGILE